MKKLFGGLLFLCLLCPVCYAVESPPSISASCAVLMDAESGRVLYEKDAHTQKGIASITKLLTALVAVESTPDLSRTVTVTEEHITEGTSMYLKVGEVLTLEELLYGLLLQSGNDAALAVATCCAGDVETFVAWMNEWAEDLGMTDSRFANPSGLDEEGHYSTAYDMALVARAVLQNETLSRIVATRTAVTAGRSLKNHNKLLWQYEGCVGMKTGYTMRSGRTLVSGATRNGQTLICVTLNAPDDWADHTALLDYGFGTWTVQTLAEERKLFRSLPVRGSLIPRVRVVIANTVRYPLSEQEGVRTEVELAKRTEAPVAKGQAAGKLIFYLEQEKVGETALLYEETAPDNRASPTLRERLFSLLFNRSADASQMTMAIF